jgi:hypothetical protein
VVYLIFAKINVLMPAGTDKFSVSQMKIGFRNLLVSCAVCKILNLIVKSLCVMRGKR